MAIWHPWRVLRSREDVGCSIVDLPDGTAGQVWFATQRVEIASDLLQRERRSALSHELVHLERGPCGGCSAREEQAVQAESARRLIPFADLVEALLWTQDEWELAEELWVDVDTVLVRLQMLSAGERAIIEARIDSHHRMSDVTRDT